MTNGLKAWCMQPVANGCIRVQALLGLVEAEAAAVQSEEEAVRRSRSSLVPVGALARYLHRHTFNIRQLQLHPVRAFLGTDHLYRLVGPNSLSVLDACAIKQW